MGRYVWSYGSGMERGLLPVGELYRADHLSGQTNSAEEECGGGEVLILLDRSVSLPSDIPLWVEDLKFLVKIKEIDGAD